MSQFHFETFYSMQMQKLWRQINQQPCFFSCHHHKFLLKQAFSEKQNLKTSNISHSKRKTFEKDSNTALTTRQCHIRFGNGQTIGNLGVYHRFRSLEYRSRKSGTKTQSYCQSRRTWLEITFGTSKILTHWPKNLKKKYPFSFTFWNWIRKGCYFTDILSRILISLLSC